MSSGVQQHVQRVQLRRVMPRHVLGYSWFQSVRTACVKVRGRGKPVPRERRAEWNSAASVVKVFRTGKCGGGLACHAAVSRQTQVTRTGCCCTDEYSLSSATPRMSEPFCSRLNAFSVPGTVGGVVSTSGTGTISAVPRGTCLGIGSASIRVASGMITAFWQMAEACRKLNGDNPADSTHGDQETSSSSTVILQVLTQGDQLQRAPAGPTSWLLHDGRDTSPSASSGVSLRMDLHWSP